MTDDLINQQSEIEPAPFYPRRRFVVLLAIVFVLVALFGIAQRLPQPASDAEAFSERTLAADILMKASYAPAGWARYVAAGKPARPAEDVGLLLRRNAVAAYRDAVHKDPSPSNLRRLIITGDRDDRAVAIALLDRGAAGHQPSSPDTAVWRAVYLEEWPPSRSDAAFYSAVIHKLDLGWYEKVALADLYGRAGMASEARRARADATESAAYTVAMLATLISFVTVLGILGSVLLVWYFTTRSSGRLIPAEAEAPPTESARSFLAGYLLESFVAYLAIMVGVQILALIALDLVPWLNAPRFAAFVLSAAYVLAGILSALFLAYRIRRSGFSWRTIGLVSRNPLADIGWGIGGYAASLPPLLVAGIAASVIARYISTPPNPIMPLFARSSAASERLALFMLAAILAPLFEELFFRGVLFHSFRARYGMRVGIALSAVVFALLHPFPFDFLRVLVLGWAFALLVHQRGSLLPSMIAHGLNNAVAFAILLILVGS